MIELLSINGAVPRVKVMDYKRSFNKLYNDDAGRTQDGILQATVIGVYDNFSLKFGMSPNDPDGYDEFYSLLSSAAFDYTCTFATGHSGIITGRYYISSGQDQLFWSREGKHYYKGFTGNFIAVEPSRR